MFQYDPSVTTTPGWVEPLRRKLKTAVKARKLSQQRIATAAGITQSAVSQFLNEDTNEPTGNLLVEGCRLLNISVDELAGLDRHESDHLSEEATFEERRALLGEFATALVDVLARADAGKQTPESRTTTAKRSKGDRTDR